MLCKHRKGELAMSEGKVMQTGTTGEQAKTKVGVQGVPETMLQTLFARAAESEKENHHIYDKKAIEIVSQLDYDFSKAESDKLMSSGVIARTIVLDRLVNDYLTKHPDAIVVNIACGLDTRCYRMKGKYQRWYNIDLPETMDIRSRFLEENGPVYQIAKSATDPSYTVDIEYHGEPVLVVIEGLTMYLTEQDVRKMFEIIDQTFTQAKVLVEVMAPFVVKHMKEKSIEGSRAKFIWGVKSGKAFQSVTPSFRSERDISLVEGMKEFAPIYKVLGKIPSVRNFSNKILVLNKR